MCDPDLPIAKGMKRIGNLYGRIISLENLYLADQKARKGKSWQPAVQAHLLAWERNLYSLHHVLATKSFQTSEYTVFKVYEPKEREVYRLPYYPDRIVHHAIMNVLEPIFTSIFTADTYSCVRGKGIHGAADAVKAALKDQSGTRYCLKLDIRKFYPTVNHGVLKCLLGRKFKDPELLWLLEEIIDSAPGLPIGNYLSQYFANFYLTGFDHWIKEVKGIRYYFRYADDLVILARDKATLHALLADIRLYLSSKLRLEIKGNYQVFPIAARGIDFVGYVFFHTHTRLRKSIKQNFARSLSKKPSLASLVSYYGWIKHCNGNHLLKKLLHEKVQRLQRHRGNKSLPGRQDQDRPNPKQRDHCDGGQDRTIRIQRKGEWPSAPISLHCRRSASHPLFRLLDPNGNDQTRSAGGISLRHNNCQTK